ncbi:hypothetical protein JCM14036_24980 [Desulfotomaculum defluvii]
MACVKKSKKNVPSTWEEALQFYLMWKKAEGLREITLQGHKDVIGLFYRRHPEAYNTKTVKISLYAFMGEDIKTATYNIRRNYLKQFFDWCVREGVYDDNPMSDLKKRTDEGRVVNLDAETLGRLLTLPDCKTYAGLRDYALFLLTLDTGIRPKEAFSLEIADVNIRASEVYVRSDVAE